MTLTGMQRRRLRALAQPRPARVRVGKRGPTDALLAELDSIAETASMRSAA